MKEPDYDRIWGRITDRYLDSTFSESRTSPEDLADAKIKEALEDQAFIRALAPRMAEK